MGVAASCAKSGWPIAARAVARIAVAIGLALFVGACEQQAENPEPAEQTGANDALPLGNGFDFYVLALSWSPSYCEAEGEDANRQQCASGRPFAFIVHGLWPQYERGFPADCGTSEPDVDDATLRGLYDLVPSAGLIRHQWRKHGTCSGLSQADYFRTLRLAREKVSIPPEFRRLDDYQTLTPGLAETAFIKVNEGLAADAVAVTCDKRYLREVRLCLTTDLHFRSCPEVDRRACRVDKVVMPPVSGG